MYKFLPSLIIAVFTLHLNSMFIDFIMYDINKYDLLGMYFFIIIYNWFFTRFQLFITEILFYIKSVRFPERARTGYVYYEYDNGKVICRV